MIDLYLANSGNSLRAAIALEECGLEFRKHILDLDGGTRSGRSSFD
jgi:glutathione S-transferase